MQCHKGAEEAKVPLGELSLGEHSPGRKGDAAGPSAAVTPFLAFLMLPPEPALLGALVRFGYLL